MIAVRIGRKLLLTGTGFFWDLPRRGFSAEGPLPDRYHHRLGTLRELFKCNDESGHAILAASAAHEYCTT